MQHHKYSLSDIENLIPFERDVYVGLLMKHIEKENAKIEQENAKIKKAEAQAYKISEETILPIGTAPYIKAKDGKPLIEFPQTCKIDWMVSVEHMKTIFREHLKFCKQGQMSAVCLAIHENNAAQHLEKYDTVLNYIDEQILSNAEKGIRIEYSTLSAIRDNFFESKANLEP